MDIPTQLVISIISIILSIFFSGIEIVFNSSNRIIIELEKKQATFASLLVSFFSQQTGKYFATIFICKIIVIALFCISFSNIIHKYIFFHISNNEYLILFIIILITSFLILLTNYIVPKIMFQKNSNKLLVVFSFPLIIIYNILYPITIFIIFITHLIQKIFLKTEINDNNDKLIFGKTKLNFFLTNEKINHKTTDETDNEIKILKNAMEFSEVKLRECIVPRNEIVALSIDCSIEELQQKFVETGYSKIMIYIESIDNITGYAHSKDLFKKPKNIKNILNELIIVPESMPASKLLDMFFKEHKNVALIVDEFGGTSGIVTMEDLIEEIFGEINDEFDTNDLIEKQLFSNEYLLSGRLEIEYLNEKYDLKIPESETYKTLSGYILFLNETIPNEGDQIMTDLYNFVIQKVKGPKIESIKLFIQNKNKKKSHKND